MFGVILFVVFGSVIALGSWIFVSGATAGVAGICFACFLGILTRVIQAEVHHRQVLKRTQKWNVEVRA